MQYFEATQYLQVPAGARLHLTDAQAAARTHALACEKGEDGRFRATAIVNFKRGEQFGCDQVPGGAQALELGEREFGERIDSERKAAAAAKAQALAKRNKDRRAQVEAQKKKEEEWRRAAEQKAAQLAAAAGANGSATNAGEGATQPAKAARAAGKSAMARAAKFGRDLLGA